MFIPFYTIFTKNKFSSNKFFLLPKHRKSFRKRYCRFAEKKLQMKVSEKWIKVNKLILLIVILLIPHLFLLCNQNRDRYKAIN